MLVRTTKFDADCARLADGHYSRRTVGSPQFMPPGQTVVLRSLEGDVVFGWWRPHPDRGIVAMNGLDGWTCTIFRNCSSILSSLLILSAEKMLVDTGHGCGPDGLLTYVWDKKTAARRSRSSRPGECFRQANWNDHATKPRSADGKKSLLVKPWERAGL